MHRALGFFLSLAFNCVTAEANVITPCCSRERMQAINEETACSLLHNIEAG